MRFPPILCFAAALMFLLPGEPVVAQGVGNLTVTPTRIVFEGRTRSEVVTLVNNGSEPATYRISVIEMRMRDDGRFERIAEDGDQSGVQSAKGLFRFAPRQVDLQPGQTQSIRILLRKPPELPEGEYRSHMFIQAIPKEGAGRSVENLGGSQDLTINLTIIPGITLPVIVRHGNLSASASLSDFSIGAVSADDPTPTVSFTINRSGTRSLYGDLTATYFPASRNNGVVVSQIKLLAVYVPNPSRTVVMPLTMPEGVKLDGGNIKVTFTTPPSEGAVELASGEHPVPRQ